MEKHLCEMGILKDEILETLDLGIIACGMETPQKKRKVKIHLMKGPAGSRSRSRPKSSKVTTNCMAT